MTKGKGFDPFDPNAPIKKWDPALWQNGLQAAPPSLSGIEIVESAQLPDVPTDYWHPPKEETTSVIVAQPGDDEDNSGKLDSLVSLALDTLREVMETPTPGRSDEAYGRILSAKKDAAVSVVNSGLKADENRFRKRQNDVLQKLFEKVQLEKQAKLGRVIEGMPLIAQ